jgi:hypothetical protein
MRAQKGLYNGTLPFGYMRGEDGVPVAHLANAEGLRMAFRSYSTGRYSDRGIAELLNREGYRTTGNWGERPFTKDTVNRLLKNVFYRGYVKYKGELIQGQHPALIDQELFDKCQEVRAGRRNRARSMGETRRVYVLSGIARCSECELTLRCMSSKNQRYYRHTAHERGYDCSVPGTTVRAEVLEEQWADIISAVILPEDWRQRIEELAGNADQREAILKERAMIQEKLRRLKMMYRDLLIGDAEYRSTVDQLQTKLASLVLPNSPHVVRAGEYLEQLGMLWARATLEEQREVTRMLLKGLYVDVVNEQIVAIEPMPLFKTLFSEFCDDIGVTIL